MKPVSIIVGALAAFATAAPTKETTAVATRGNNDFSGLNNFAFNDLNFQYLNQLNGFDLQLLAQLSQVNNFNVLGFQSLFQSNVFDIANLLQLQQLQVMLQFAQLGLFNSFDLSSLSLNQLNLGLISGIGGFDVNSLIDSSLVPQINSFIQSSVVIAKE